MKEGMNKKGISNIIITLLLVLVSLALIALVWAVVSTILQSSSGSIQGSSSFQQLLLDLKISAANLETDGTISVQVKRETGQGDVSGIKFVFFDGQDSETIEEKTVLNELEEKRFVLALNQIDSSKAQTVSIASITKSSSGTEITGQVTDVKIISKTPSQGGAGGAEGTGQVCRNGRAESPEQCDDGNSNDNDACKNDCTLNVPTGCNNDGNLDSGEICDGINFGTYSCDSLFGLGLGGELTCTNCQIGTVSCNRPGESPSCTATEDANCGFYQCNLDSGSLDFQHCKTSCADAGADCKSGYVCISGQCIVPPDCGDGEFDIGEQCDSTSGVSGSENCIPAPDVGQCTCKPAYLPDSSNPGGCKLEEYINQGPVDSVWPVAGSAKYFDSEQLPKDSQKMVEYMTSYYVNFPNNLAETRCLKISYAEYILESNYNKSYIRMESNANINAGDIYDVWQTRYCGVAP